jgi:hypothetical protein
MGAPHDPHQVLTPVIKVFMPVIAHQNKPAAGVERRIKTNNTPLAAAMIQLSMTYRGSDTSCDVDTELWQWVEASSESLGVCAIAFLIGCAEHVREME